MTEEQLLDILEDFDVNLAGEIYTFNPSIKEKGQHEVCCSSLISKAIGKACEASSKLTYYGEEIEQLLKDGKITLVTDPYC